MKGYKAFKKGLICDPTGNKPFQFAENTVFEERKAEVCKSGFHFCAEPMDVLNYYPPESEFAEVEALDDVKTDDSVKYVTKKIRIGAKISLKDLISAQVDIDFAKAKEDGSERYAQGYCGHAAAQGNYGHAAEQGKYGHAAAQGNKGHAATQGYCGHAAAQGAEGHAATQGYCGHAAAQGYEGHAVAQGDCGHAAAQGAEGHAVAQGYCGHAAAQGYEGHAVAQGDYGHAAAQGAEGHAEVDGKDAIAAAFGIEGKAKACIGSWIMLAEWELKNGNWHIASVKTAQIDGEKLKADTWYILKNGKFEEAEE